ncbi:adenine nucleotide alpha hydrolases-like protein [Xylariaceae sp. FL0662B]|nr:adenine nucleotide alpha hydrolases-like protein [Xylariaceae sp. FL0662B]
MAEGPLDVIALVSGGKDSFFSILHCLANGHRVVALANLHPPQPLAKSGTDLNSFMYQTVGHQVIPLYAQATGLPLFRQPILGSAVHHGISYQDPADEQPSLAQEQQDETESLVPLLRAVIRAHPAANALCTGAILSTYQRTRVESVALRLGLVPLAYLWQFPELPISSPPLHLLRGDGTASAVLGALRDDAQLLRDMAAVGLEARIVKVASAGLDEDFLWENVADEAGVRRVERALRRFGGGGRGSVLGEGGEFETLVVDGPPALFKGRIVVRDEARRVVREGGGSAWLSIRDAAVEMKDEAALRTCEAGGLGIRVPELFDPNFKDVLDSLRDEGRLGYAEMSQPSPPSLPRFRLQMQAGSTQNWCFSGAHSHSKIEDQTVSIVNGIMARLSDQSLPATAITDTIIVLRQMSDFSIVNKLYGSLFREPNPPARITISCGDLLPHGTAITIYLTVQPHLIPDERRGLHVQSRSYWAPANIGPYSQAIAFPLLGNGEQDDQQQNRTDSPVAVSIAGQVPLIPFSMTLPPESPDNLAVQVTLALQHLWRIGVEMQVQWWSGAVAYFPHTPSPGGMRHKALLAATAWRSAHLSSGSADRGDEDEDEDGPDLWDRKYNPQYMSFAGGDGDAAAARPALPDWEVLRGGGRGGDGDGRRPVPFVFSAEVEELPRQAGVEWHAHAGFAKVSAACIQLGNEASLGVSRTTIDHASTLVGNSLASLATAQSSLADLDAAVAAAAIKPKLTYVEASRVRDDSLREEAIIPCRSLWDSQGNRLAMVSVFGARLVRADEINT